MLNLQFSVSFFRIEVEEEIRKQVDELMRQELKNLKMVCTDRGVIHLGYTAHTTPLRGTQRQFWQNNCSEDDLRSTIFGIFFPKLLACLPLLGFSNI